MMITTRNETFHKIEMTAAQANILELFLDTMQNRQIFDVAKMADMTTDETRELQETLEALQVVLAARTKYKG